MAEGSGVARVAAGSSAENVIRGRSQSRPSVSTHRDLFTLARRQPAPLSHAAGDDASMMSMQCGSGSSNTVVLSA